MARLPSVLGTTDLPLAELCAARIDGDVVEIRGGFVPIDEPDLPSLRALLVALGAEPDLIVDRMSAAWVHGAELVPPAQTQFCIDARTRSTAHIGRGQVREVLFEPGDVDEIGGVRCTSRLRTVYDLLRDVAAPDDAVLPVVGELLDARPGLADAVRERFDGSFRLPHKKRALARLDEVVAALAVRAD
ncbi:hypothetical protein GE115_01560 [Agromyces sp. CFH 90414]|uniref:AbiEi antitoxin C-terminal domain-containing protein n=1 Tax=Agromyces agglutinans TaxID=2662258 RepID=A0A6I2FBM1_9MICO|nr:hypothetical protein [Agromyces agglutinans]MRG58568.1 hypothetical protein [Agromyces agglutinans]